MKKNRTKKRKLTEFQSVILTVIIVGMIIWFFKIVLAIAVIGLMFALIRMVLHDRV